LFFDPKASIDEKRFGMSKPDTLDNQGSLCDDEGPIPEFPALAVDSSSGRILPIIERHRADSLGGGSSSSKSSTIPA
jgi:hypothetical protein